MAVGLKRRAALQESAPALGRKKRAEPISFQTAPKAPRTRGVEQLVAARPRSCREVGRPLVRRRPADRRASVREPSAGARPAKRSGFRPWGRYVAPGTSRSRTPKRRQLVGRSRRGVLGLSGFGASGRTFKPAGVAGCRRVSREAGEAGKNDCAPRQRARGAQSTSLLKRTAWRGECWQIATVFVEFSRHCGSGCS